MFRRLIVLLRRQWVSFLTRPIPIQEKLAMDIDEFARLLKSGKSEDMKLIAHTLSRLDKIKI